MLILALAAVLLAFDKREPLSGQVFSGGETYILIDNRILRLRKGWLPARGVIALADIVRNGGVSRG